MIKAKFIYSILLWVILAHSSLFANDKINVFDYKKDSYNVDSLTGSWRGILFEKYIELELWPNSNGFPVKDVKDWIGYFYSSHYDCFMKARLAVNPFNGTTKHAALDGFSNNEYKNNCTKNINKLTWKGAAVQFRSRGTFKLVNNSAQLQLDLEIYAFGDNLPSNTVITMHRATISNKVSTFLLGSEKKPFTRSSTGTDQNLTRQVVIKKVELTPFKSLTESLESGELNHIQVNEEFMTYYTTFIQKYSNLCKNNIEKPVVRKVSLIKTKNNSGFETSKQIGDTDIIYIDERYVEKFDAYMTRSNTIGVFNVINSYLTNGLSAIAKKGNQLIANNNYLNNYIAGNCNSNKLKLTYYNLHKQSIK